MGSSEHLVQFYGQDEPALAGNVAAYLADSLREGGAALVIAAASRREAIQRAIERHGRSEAASERLLLLDDAKLLGTFMCGDVPDEREFAANVGALVKDLRKRYGRLRAYGEMVGLLWSQRAFAAAISLERLWNDLMASVAFDLYCGYPSDVLSDEFQIPGVRPVLAEHSELVPALSSSFADAMRRAASDILGDGRHGIHVMGHPAFPTLPTALPNAEGAILRLRSVMPRYADPILAKAKEYAV